jgi:hypothetical protein
MSLRSFRLVFTTAALLLAPSAASAAWTVPPTPNVAGANSTNLRSVDCSSANSCMAVGNAVFPGGFKLPSPSTTVAERWDGTSWQVVPSPNPPGATWSELNGISCPLPRICFAVGFWRTDPNSPFGSGIPRPLIELWDGTSWSIQPGPDVPQGSLDAVSCSGLLACTAVGSVLDQSLHQPLAERWDGTGWHVQSTPTPNSTDPHENSLLAVSCPRRGTCTAVGGSTTFGACPPCGPSDRSPLVERWFGRVDSWGLEAAKPDGFDSGFSGVSCPDGRVCFAVGWFLPSSVSIATLAERRVGLSWSVMPTPNPPRPPPNQASAQLTGVSCPGRRACHAVGIGDVAGHFGTFAERFDGASWQLESIPTNGLEVPALSDVSCPSRFFCMAVGTVSGSSGPATLAAKWTP